MSHNHPALLYHSQKGLCDKLFEFFNEGINKSERCVYLTTENDSFEMYEKLITKNDKPKVTKLFSYFFMPDPITSPEEFVIKITNLQENILTKKFQGRVGFNVLKDVSRFSIEDVSNIENVEKYLHQISNNNLKLFCSFKVGKESETASKMIKMVMTNHDYAIFEKEDGSFSQKDL